MPTHEEMPLFYCVCIGIHLLVFGVLWDAEDKWKKTRWMLVYTFFWEITFSVIILCGLCMAVLYIIISIMYVPRSMYKVLRYGYE